MHLRAEFRPDSVISAVADSDHHRLGMEGYRAAIRYVAQHGSR